MLVGIVPVLAESMRFFAWTRPSNLMKARAVTDLAKKLQLVENYVRCNDIDNSLNYLLIKNCVV